MNRLSWSLVVVGAASLPLSSLQDGGPGCSPEKNPETLFPNAFVASLVRTGPQWREDIFTDIIFFFLVFFYLPCSYRHYPTDGILNKPVSPPSSPPLYRWRTQVSGGLRGRPAPHLSAVTPGVPHCGCEADTNGTNRKQESLLPASRPLLRSLHPLLPAPRPPPHSFKGCLFWAPGFWGHGGGQLPAGRKAWPGGSSRDHRG